MKREKRNWVLEGVVMSLRQGLEIMLDLGVPGEKIVASGGATNHPLWLQLQADIFNRPIYPAQTREAAAVGAAILAGVGVGVYNNLQEACNRTVRWHEEVVYPNPKNVDIYNRNYPTFTQPYPALANLQTCKPATLQTCKPATRHWRTSP